jgi:glycosyltransferase involved in cell wall biosynthesis
MLDTGEEQPSRVRPRLLWVGAFPPPHRKIFGGILTNCSTLLESSLPRKINLTLVDSTQISNPPPGLHMRLLLALKRLFLFVHRFERDKPDAILLFAAPGASLLEKGTMAWYAKLRRIPALLFPMGGATMDDYGLSAWARLVVHFAASASAKILCQGETWQTFVVNILGRPIAHAPIISSWTASSKLLEVGAGRKKRDLSPEVRLLFVGWLTREKGVLDLMDACLRLDSKCAFSLDLVGDGTAKTDAAQRIRDTPLEARVRFRGWLQGPELLEAFRDADAFVLASWAEGLPNAMIEAMAAGLPVVASCVGAIPDVITNHDTGLLVKPRDIEELTEALRRIINDAPLRGRLGSRSHDVARAKFGVELAVDRLVAEIEAVAQ